MILHENRLLADDSHEISYSIYFENLERCQKKLSSAAVLIGALRVNVYHPHLTLQVPMKTAEGNKFCDVFLIWPDI